VVECSVTVAMVAGLARRYAVETEVEVVSVVLIVLVSTASIVVVERQ
jgi:hypothetical protein